MKIWGAINQKSLPILMLTAASVAFAGYNQGAQNGFRYGPNLSWRLMGNTPFVWGQWLRQAEGKVHYTWLEPLTELDYGSYLENSPSYLKMDAAVELSPFYGGYLAGLGLRPFRTNPQFEVNFVYESYMYYKSNLEMVTADVKGGGRIAETWNADYITDNVWKSDAADLDYVQLFDINVSLEFFFLGKSIIGTCVHYILSDVSTDFEGKSYDYKRNIPVFSRDFLLELETYGRLVFSKHWAGVFESTYYRTGYLRNGNTVQKESLGYALIKAGPHFSWYDGFRSVTLKFGMWKRPKKRFYDGSLSQQFLVQLEYQGYFSFPIHKRLSE